MEEEGDVELITNKEEEEEEEENKEDDDDEDAKVEDDIDGVPVEQDSVPVATAASKYAAV
tara:strand:+ start:1374 stop:1553 length:180 start_codon:yes stop_codon:yes gene_type:complete